MKTIEMEVLLRCILLSFMMGIGCQLFFETIIPLRKWRHRWVEYTAIPAFAAGFMVNGVMEMPPYILMPVRVIAVVFVVAQVYFQISPVKNLILSVLFCGIYWIISTVALSGFYLLPSSLYETRDVQNTIETMAETVHLCLMAVFHYQCKDRFRGLTGTGWERFGIFPFLGMVVIMALNMIPGTETAADKYARLAAVLGFTAISVCMFYFITRMLEKEAEMQRLRLRHERTQNQMNMYYQMQKNYEQQRRHLHDYKNQLDCIQGLLERGEAKEAFAYVSRLTGNLKTNVDHINTNHTVVNVVLNQKYQSAREKGIAMTFSINDLSELTMGEEAIVTLLTNLIDNAAEACEKLAEHKVIQFKMVLEDRQLILSIRNPVDRPVRIKGNKIVTSKQDSSRHGIGLLNVDAVIQKHNGTSVLKCEDGWFSFSAMIPVEVGVI